VLVGLLAVAELLAEVAGWLKPAEDRFVVVAIQGAAPHLC